MGSSAASSVMAAARERGLALIAAFGCALTRRQLTVLRAMRDREDAEIVREHGVAYLGDERVASRTVDALLRACAVKDVSSGSLERYRMALPNKPPTAPAFIGKTRISWARGL